MRSIQRRALVHTVKLSLIQLVKIITHIILNKKWENRVVKLGFFVFRKQGKVVKVVGKDNKIFYMIVLKIVKLEINDSKRFHY